MPDPDVVLNAACSNGECTYSTTQLCVEGVQPAESCAHLGRTLKHKTGVLPSNLEIALPSGNTLSFHDASKILAARTTRVISILGPKAAGKTSLIAGLYEGFQRGIGPRMTFAGSESLHAFESICHDARAVSRRAAPESMRTPRGEARFFHILIRDGLSGDITALLLADRAGEEYSEAPDDIALLSFPEIESSDTITLLVDGERLADSLTRSGVLTDTPFFMKAMIDGGAISVGQRLAIVLTKLDLVQESERTLRDFDNLVSVITARFGHKFSSVSPFRIAASPTSSSLPPGTGVPDLLGFWFGRRRISAPKSPEPEEPVRVFHRLRAADSEAMK